MSDVDRILSRAEFGAKVRFVQDYYGAEHVQVSTPIIGWPRRTYKLSSAEMQELRAALRGKRSRRVVATEAG